MDSESWEKSRDLKKMIRAVDPQRSDRKLRLFAVACCRRVWNQITTASAKRLVELTEQFADGESESESLRLVWAEVPFYPHADGAAKQAAGMDCASWQASADSYRLAAQDAETAVGESISESDSNGRRRKFERRGIERSAQLLLLRDIIGNPFQPVVSRPSGGRRQRSKLQEGCTTRVTSPRCRFWPTRFRTPAATTTTFSTTAATRIRLTCGGAGSSI